MSQLVHRRENGRQRSHEIIELGEYSRNGVEVEGQHSIKNGADSGEGRTPPLPRTILDPQGPFIHLWNKILLVSCVIAVSVDPLFFYIPVINDAKRCLMLEKKLRIVVLVLRTVTDVIYIVHIILQFRTAFIDKIVEEGAEITSRYSWKHFIIDILVILPIPQVVLLQIIYSEMRSTRSSDSIKWLNALVLFQYVPRVRQIYISWKELTKSKGKFVGWVKAAFIFFLYILSSHVIGAFWYFFSIERETVCWHKACKNQSGCARSSFSCAHSGNYTFLDDLCPINAPNSTLFDFGIFLEALQSGVVQSSNLPTKFFFCFWWGLRNLSSFGQNLQTSNYPWESCFAIFISLFGLLLFLCFLENLKNYIQSATESSDEDRKTSGEKRLENLRKSRQRIVRGEIQVWAEKYMFPDEKKQEIMNIFDENWKEDIHVNVENLFLILPPELKSYIKHHLCFHMLEKVPVLENMEERLLHMICESLKPVSYKEYTYIVREGEPIDTTYFITRGIAWTYTTRNNNGEATGSSHAECLEKGHFFGEELIQWGLGEASLSNLFRLPLSSKVVKSHTKVEAFALMADDLRNIVSRTKFHVSEEELETKVASMFQAALRGKKEKSSQSGTSGGDEKLPSSSGTQVN
ncbi:cyclic nucleotide-gated ion channel 1-like isoform X1 [Quercus robur]|uniref:cyclic nucleotide-gated ion channel 1-like isoform X1 n=2 Tax=Quercus robur TaxID=38942 RepID=UPI002161731E|nr:cyclic nucleotide-gated ion channel 1-like isoform X1 [Quercus robur]